MTAELLEDASPALLLDSLVELELDCGVTIEEEDSSTLDEDVAALLLEFSDDSGFTELEDSLVSFSSFEEEDFAFPLLDEVTSAGSVTSPPLEEDDSTLGSSFCPADTDELSPHPTNANAATPIATRNFFI